MLSSSFLTQRLRDKAIAQQIQQKTQTGKPIIIPQAGYGSYTGGDADNGAINAYNKVQGCTTVDVACQCASITLPPVQVEELPDIILLNVTIAYKGGLTAERYLEVAGSGTINWGDGSITSFSNLSVTGIYHTYTSPAGCPESSEDVTVTITGKPTTLKLSESVEEQQDPNYQGGFPFIGESEITFIKAENLITLISLSGNLQAINGFDKTISLLNVQLGYLDLSNNDFNTLTQLQNIYLVKIEALQVDSQNRIINTFPNAITFIINGYAGNIIGIDTLYDSNPVLQILGLSNISTIINTNIPPLPSTLLQLYLSNNSLISSCPTLPAGLESLDISNTSISTLPVLPSTLLKLIISSTSITSLPSPVPANLVELNMNSCNLSVTGIPTNLPNSLEILDVGSCQLTLPLLVDFTVLTPQLTRLIINGIAPSGAFDPAFPSTLTYIDISSNSLVTSYPQFPSSLIELVANNNSSVITYDLSQCTNLKKLYLDSITNVTTLSSFPNSLEELYINNSVINSAITLSNTSLIKLYASGTQFFNNIMPLLPNSLQGLYCASSNINNLPNPLPSSLEELDINNCNNLTSITPSLMNLMNLNSISASNTQITSFPDIPLSLKYLVLNSITLPSFQYPSNLATSNLEELDISFSVNISTIPQLPVTLIVLYAQGCSALTDSSLPTQFPNSLQQLYISQNNNITVIPSLANTQLSSLYLESMSALIKIPNLPSTLGYLYVANMAAITGFTDTSLVSLFCLLTIDLINNTNLSSLPILPPSLQTLNLQGNNLLDSSLPSSFSDSLINLTISQNNSNITVISSLANTQLTNLYLQLPNLLSLPDLPPSLQTLILEACTNLTDSSLPQSFPDSLINLTITQNNISVIPSLANTQLTTLYLTQLPNLSSLPILPPLLQILSLQACSSLTNSSLPSSFPDSLINLVISQNNNISVIPSLANTQLTYLELKQMSDLSSLPILPLSLDTLILEACTNLTDSSLPQSFPDSLINLTISQNDNISVIQSLTNTQLTNLYVNQMSNLVLIPNLPSTINYIEASNQTDVNPYALQGFADTSLASFTNLNTLLITNMKSTLFVSPFPLLPLSISTIDIANGSVTGVINNQLYIEAIAQNIIDNGPITGGTFNASNMGILLQGSLASLDVSPYDWGVIV
jgi:hypothetical protein